MKLAYLSIIALTAFMPVATDAKETGSKNDPEMVIPNGEGLEFFLNQPGFRYGFRDKDRTLVRPHHEAGLLAGPISALSAAKSTKYLGEEDTIHRFEVILQDGRKILVRMEFTGNTARFELENPAGDPIAMALRNAGASPGYGLGDMVTAGWRGSKQDKAHRYQTEITGYASYDFRSTTGSAARMMSNFAIYPADRFAVVNIDPGAKIVVSKSDEILQGSRHTSRIDALYYFLRSPADIYAAFRKARNRHGFPVMQPGYDMNQDRGPVNTLALAYSGFPLTYMDIVGGLFGGREFDGEVSDRIKTYLMRNARTASLHSSISMGKGPWHYNDPLVSEILLECANLHARLHPYIHSNAIKFYRDGYPHTMTPLPIAFPDDPRVHGRENSSVRGFQRMIGDALMACPLYGEDYETATTRDIYLPQGVWIDYDEGTLHEGPVMLENFPMPVTKTPLFVGGTGIVVEEIDGELMARIYPVAERAETTFIGRDGKTVSTITIAKPDWENPVITDVKTGTKITSQVIRHAHQFTLQEGQDYLIR